MQKIAFWQTWLPHPVVSILVALSWIMLAHSLDAATLLMAALLAVFIPRLVDPFLTSTPNIDWRAALKLFVVVLWDIIVCNVKVAKLVLGPTRNLQPKWFRVPLDSQHEQVNVLLAMIITTTQALSVQASIKIVVIFWYMPSVVTMPSSIFKTLKIVMNAH